MSDIITQPGFYRENCGGKAQITFVDAENRVAMGKTSTGSWSTYGTGGGYSSGEASRFSLDITGPWIDEPDPGEGWRLLKDDEPCDLGDQRQDGCDREPRRWLPCDRGVAGLTLPEARTKYPNLKFLAFRRRIPEWKPTCELRWSKSADANIGSVEYVKTDIGRWNFADLEQKWVCGDKSEWRAIEVKQ